MTKVSGAYDKKIFDGKTIQLKISEENNKHRWVYIGSDKVCSFLTNDVTYKYISNIGNNKTPFSFAIGSEYIFLTPLLKFIERETINNDELLHTNEKSVDPCDLHVSRCGKHSFEKMKTYKIHSIYD